MKGSAPTSRADGPAAGVRPRLLAEGGEGGPPLSPEAVRRGWAQRVLGLPQDGDASLRALLDGLAFSPDWDEQAVTRRTEELLYQYFHRRGAASPTASGRHLQAAP